MIRRCASAVLAFGLLTTASGGSAGPIDHPDTAGMDPALAGQIESARALVEESSELGAAQEAEAWGELGMLYQATGFEQAGLSAYGQAAALDPLDGRWPYLEGIVLGGRGQSAEARRRFLNAIALDPSLAEPGWTRIGRLFLDDGEARLAIRAFERALAIDQEAPAVLAGLGEAHLAIDNPEQARDFLERALEAEPRANRLHYPLAMALRGLGEAEAMQRHLERAGPIGVTPDDPVADYLASHAAGSRIHILQGRKAWQAGDAAAAAESFARAASADPDSAVAWTNLGTAQAELDRLEQAHESLSRAIELDPVAERARQNLVAVLRRLDRPARALAVIDQAPGQPESARWRLVESARILFGLGEYGRAADRLLLALEERRDLELWTETLTALVMAGRREEAYALATHEKLSPASDPVLADWVRDLVESPAAQPQDLAMAARLTEQLYARNGEERFAALHINTLLRRHGRCREALAWIAAQLDGEHVPQPLATLLTQWSLRLSRSPECSAGGAADDS